MPDDDQNMNQNLPAPRQAVENLPQLEGGAQREQGLVDQDALLERMLQIVETHRDDPGRACNEDRFRRLANRLLQEKAEIAQGLIEDGLPEDEAAAEFARRAEAVDRFATMWTPGDPLEARPRGRNDTAEAANVPAPRGQALLANDLGWTPLLALPGYADTGRLGVAIRTLGDAIFRALPCFAAMSRAAEENDLDPLGQVQVLSSLSERQQGVVRDRIEELGRFAFPVRRERMRDLNWLPGYRPDIRICFSEEHSFLTVRERRSAGAPIDADYIYSWMGGVAFYRDHPEQIATLRNVVDLGEHAILPTSTPATTPRIGM
jgi:hypothetical protein